MSETVCAFCGEPITGGPVSGRFSQPTHAECAAAECPICHGPCALENRHRGQVSR